MTSQKKRPSSKGHAPQNKLRRIFVLLTLTVGFYMTSCANLGAGAGHGHEPPVRGGAGLDEAVHERTTPDDHAESWVAPDTFANCRQFFANGKPPVVAPRPTHRALCYDAFAILHSGEGKTAVFVAEKLNRKSIADADEKRTNKFFADARLRSAERATLDDYKGSRYDRGHMAPAADMPTANAMAQSFSLANMVPQAPEHNRGVWAKSVELATRKYASRASGNVFVITGPIYEHSIAQSPSIEAGHVRVPAYLFKLVYDEDHNRAWVHWHRNDDATRGTKPISYSELVRRTGIKFLPGITPAE